MLQPNRCSCGSYRVEVATDHDRTGKYVECRACGKRGPLAPNEPWGTANDRAVEAWNAENKEG